MKTGFKVSVSVQGKAPELIVLIIILCGLYTVLDNITSNFFFCQNYTQEKLLPLAVYSFNDFIFAGKREKAIEHERIKGNVQMGVRGRRKKQRDVCIAAVGT